MSPDPQETLDAPPTAWTPSASPLAATISVFQAPPSPASTLATGGARRPPIASYELLETLGRGGMAVVYKARQQGLGRVVALKMILAGASASSEEIARFRIEAEAVASLRHPNIVQIFEVGESEGSLFYSLELVEGGTLAQKLKADSMTYEEIARVVEKLARAMHAAHQRGVIHRDLKPSNVLMTTDGEPKIADFGLAKRMDKEIGQTQTGAVLGTPSYMAPEQALGKKTIGPATDIYGLGAILYEALAQRPPFQDETIMSTLSRVISQEPAPPRKIREGVPRNLEIICLKCLEKDPGRRYATAEDLADDLKRFLLHEPIAARPPTLFGKVDRWARRHPALAATLAGLIVLYANHLLLMGLQAPGEGGGFHWFVTGLTVSWWLGASAFDRLATKSRFRVPALYGWAAMDIVLLTILLLRADGPHSSILIVYHLLIAGAALRFRAALVWFVAAMAAISYAGLVWDASWRRPELQAPLSDRIIFALSILIISLIQHMMLRRLRAATED